MKPHDPEDRIVVDTIDAGGPVAVFGFWEVRAFDPTGSFHHYFAARELLHIQFWNPHFGVSIVSPSRLTAWHYEAYPVAGWPDIARSYDELVRRLQQHYALTAPSPNAIHAACAVFVDAPTRSARHASPVSETPTAQQAGR